MRRRARGLVPLTSILTPQDACRAVRGPALRQHRQPHRPRLPLLRRCPGKREFQEAPSPPLPQPLRAVATSVIPPAGLLSAGHALQGKEQLPKFIRSELLGEFVQVLAPHAAGDELTEQ